ncbi:MAG: DUF3520 domain-containing protein [Acidobacteria bacterium]|nr:DUF3520 domain-containing protein [Acidobacteriota bacterium]
MVDEGNQPLPGATVVVSSPRIPGSKTTVTDAKGKAKLEGLHPGTYSVTFEHPGYDKVEQQNVIVPHRSTTRVNPTLHHQWKKETLVTSQAPIVDVTSTTMGSGKPAGPVKALPRGRTFSSLTYRSGQENMRAIPQNDAAGTTSRPDIPSSGQESRSPRNDLEGTGRINIGIKDVGNRPLAGVVVTAISPGMKNPVVATSDADGKATLSNLKPSTYKVTIAHPDYKRIVLGYVPVPWNKPAIINVTLWKEFDSGYSTGCQIEISKPRRPGEFPKVLPKGRTFSSLTYLPADRLPGQEATSPEAPKPPREAQPEATAQRKDPQGTLTFHVDDDGNQPLPGVSIVATHQATGKTRTTTTDADGNAVLKGLKAGLYRVTFSHPGYQKIVQEYVPLHPGQTIRMTPTLHQVIPKERLVISQAPVVDVTSTTMGFAPPAATVREYDLTARRRLPSSPEGRPIPSTGGTAEPNDRPYGDVFFDPTGVNPFVDTEDDRLSTFGLDVDTGSYTVTRRYIRDGHLPPPAAIRVEEFVNAFGYGDPAPRHGDFNLVAEGAPDPFGDRERSYILRFAVTARQVDTKHRPPALLIFTVDVSGSMARENRLGLVKRALGALLDELRPDDRVGLVVFGSTGRVLLEPTRDHEAIREAIERLRPGGSTNAEDGLVLAYRMADRFRDGLEEEESGQKPIIRVILCSDGVANVGRSGPRSILERIRRAAGKGIELTTVGFGMGNYNDTLMERLADTGDGRYAYVDDFEEAHRIFVEELTGTLLTIAHDARAQVEFDPRAVERWRLLGYENRDIADERFRDPTVDAGEVGAGQTVTALYEVKLRPRIPSHRIVATLRLRYRPTGSQEFVEIERRLRARELARSWEDASPRLKLASLVAELAEILKHSYWAKHDSLGDVLRRLRRLHGPLARQERVRELEDLVREALMIQRNQRHVPEE